MCRVGNGGRDGPGDAVLRVAGVVALLAVAGLALRARQGLDWSALADPVQVRWTRLFVGAVLLAAVALLARRMFQRMRKLRRPAGGDGRVLPEAEPVPLLLRVLAVVLVLAAVALGWFVLDAVSGPIQSSTEPAQDRPAGDAAGSARQPTDWWLLALVGGALAVVTVGARRLAAAREQRAGTSSDSTEGLDVQELTEAVRAAETELAGHGDARAAIVAAYAAMADRLADRVRRSGGGPTAADTPTELLQRAAAAGLVEGGPAETLTALFREARFSRHPMGPAQRSAAEGALRQVLDELAARRA
jgi:hypothetical protein